MIQRLLLLLLLFVYHVDSRGDPADASEAHPDPNDEDHENMVYVGRTCENTGKRLSADHDNRVKYWFGTSFDESHKEMEIADLLKELSGSDLDHDLPHESKTGQKKSRAQVLHERKLQNRTKAGPIPYGHVETHPLDGGITPVQLVAVEPFWIDKYLVSNKEFAKFYKSTYHETEAEKYGWSFVLSSFVSNPEQYDSDPEAPHWIAVPGAYWRQPEGNTSSYKYREHHPVTHVSHRDAAAYCEWKGKRLPGEREYEAAARFVVDPTTHTTTTATKNRTVYAWGDDDSWDIAYQYANLWGATAFPNNNGRDGWRGTSPIDAFPPNALGVYDMTGNVWEWMRGGKHKARIVRGASFVDSLDGSFHHAATLGARSVLHGTTTTSNVGFRCAKAPQKRIEHHFVWHDEEVDGKLSADEQIVDDDEEFVESTIKKKKVVYKRERLSGEL